MTDLRSIFQSAAETVGELPAHLQAVAFSRAVDQLLNESLKTQNPRQPTQKRRTGGRGTASPARESGSHEGVRRSPSGLTPKSAILWLVETGFLTEAKTGRDVQEYLQQKRGYDLDTDSLRKALLRLVREEVLERDKNHDGEYVYRTAANQASAARA